MDLSSFSAHQLIDLLDRQELSAADCVGYFLARTDDQNPELNAFLTVAHESAMDQARSIDQRRQRGETVGRMAGLPVAVKDGICTEGIRTTAGSRMLEEFVPFYNATAVQRLLEADAILIGKTMMDEFGMGSSTENPHFGNTRNPWDPQRVAGGSSGGSAAAVAGGLAPLALGSDTGGSIRQPAAFCGLTGLKPTYGRVSRYGLIAYASSLEQIGPITRSAQDAALLMEICAGHDPSDSTSAQRAVDDYTHQLDSDIQGLRIGVCRDHFGTGLDSEIGVALQEALNVLQSLGAKLVDIELPHASHAVAAYYVIAPCEASANLARFDGVRYTRRAESSSLDQMYSRTRSEFFGQEVKRRILLGTFALSSGYYDQYYRKASQIRRLVKHDFDTALAEVDLLVGPTTPGTALPIGQWEDDPLSMYLADVYTVSANLAGIPALSIPCGTDANGLPIGMQLQGRPFAESTLLQVAHQYQQQTDFHTRRPD
ncbi:MAG: Asp-tRNA(Asn)/Glu-tRNA(Gln) amidotransferase subunit GatA [Mariniblastus sp.]|nr:Asp-tRNA(Asn)/Glu-tRNA(Gln) amidotransferase subunit GatA [Mariniblastus sp.]